MTDPAYWHHRRTAAHTEFRRARDLLLALRQDHHAASTSFRWPRPRYFNWALEWFDVIADSNDHPALHLLRGGQDDEVVSYAQMAAESDRTAVWLRVQGVRRGDRILVLLGAQRELWECLLACMKIGAVVVPAYTSMTRLEIADRVRRGRIQHVIFTSGTTSAPKLVAHTHVSYPVGHLSSLFWNGLQPGDRHLNVSAPRWAKHAWSSLFVPWTAEAVIVVPPEPLVPATLPALLCDHRITSVCAPPSTWQRLRPYLHAARPALREATSAGEPLPEQIVREVLAAWGVIVRDGYGQSETTALIGTSPGLPRVPGRLGKPLPGYHITLRDARGRLTQRHGEICVDTNDGVWPAGLMAGYLDGHGHRHSSAAASSSSRAFYRTGDLGERDHDGHIRVLGRTDDVFKSFGHRISPYGLEAVLKSHSAVTDAAVIPRAHPDGGAVAHAVIELAAGHHGTPAMAEKHPAALRGSPGTRTPPPVGGVRRDPPTHCLRQGPPLGSVSRPAAAQRLDHAASAWCPATTAHNSIAAAFGSPSLSRAVVGSTIPAGCSRPPEHQGRAPAQPGPGSCGELCPTMTASFL
jgi:acetyl-CoA synthetase